MSPLLINTIVGVSSIALGILFGWLLRGVMEKEQRTKKSNPNLFIAIGVVLLSILSLIGIVVSIDQYRTATECQSQYNKNFSQALAERSAASDNDRTANLNLTKSSVTMFIIVIDPQASPDQKKKALNDYIIAQQRFILTLEEAEKTREENPLPTIPECAIKTSDSN